jgi:GT2 family glycosyltransferase
MYDIGFVILHYKAIQSTIKTVESILDTCDTDNFFIVIVDNASPDGSGNRLMERYRENDKVKVILNKENKGFSAGNNIGFRYAKNVLGCEFIILSNNDIILQSKNLYKRISQDYQTYHFGVLGPKVHELNNSSESVNPDDGSLYSKENLSRAKFSLKIKILLSYLYLDEVYDFIKKYTLKKTDRDYKEKEYYDDIHTDVMLVGCFLILSPLYIEKFDGLEEITFMYYEELILYKQLEKEKMMMMYDPEISIFHESQVSSNSVEKTRRKNKRIAYKRQLENLEPVLARYDSFYED